MKAVEERISSDPVLTVKYLVQRVSAEKNSSL